MTRHEARPVSPALARLWSMAAEWQVTIDEVVERQSSVIGYGRLKNQSVVVKVPQRENDEWRSGEVLDAFGGHGVARVLTYAHGALLLERLVPGTPLADLALDGRDDEATRVLADVIARLSPVDPPDRCPTVEQWGEGFTRYRAAGGNAIPNALVDEARWLYAELSRSQRSSRLLHGDLHHYNVLSDSTRGWTAIDPKGVIGEVEFEVGALLRNPVERPELFAQESKVERRLEILGSTLKLDVRRALAWAFAQAILSAIWSLEDGSVVDATHPAVRLATAIRPMLDSRGSA